MKTDWRVDCLIIFLIFCIVTVLWQGLEILLDSGIQPSDSDTLIGLVLSVSIWKNLKTKATCKKEYGGFFFDEPKEPCKSCPKADWIDMHGKIIYGCDMGYCIAADEDINTL